MPPTIFLINLDRDKDRLRWMDDQFRRLGLTYERFDAVSPQTMQRLPADLAAKLAASRLRPGEIGCWGSHLMVMDEIIRRDLPFAVVMEDDVRMSLEFVPLLAHIGTLPANWGMLRFGGSREYGLVPIGPFGGRVDATLVKYARIPMGIGAYALSRRGAMAIRHSDTIGHAAIDAALRRWWTCGVETYGIEPFPVEHNARGDSSIEALGGVARVRRAGKSRLAYSLQRVPGEIANIRFLGRRNWIRSMVRTMFRRS